MYAWIKCQPCAAHGTLIIPKKTNDRVASSWLPLPTAWHSVQQLSTNIYSLFAGGITFGFDPPYEDGIHNVSATLKAYFRVRIHDTGSRLFVSLSISRAV